MAASSLHLPTSAYGEIARRFDRWFGQFPSHEEWIDRAAILRVVSAQAPRRPRTLPSLSMADRIITAQELWKNLAAVLRAAESGQTFTVTVRGGPVARVVPSGDRGRSLTDVDRGTVRRILQLPVDERFATDVQAAEDPVDGPCPAA